MELRAGETTKLDLPLDPIALPDPPEITKAELHFNGGQPELVLIGSNFSDENSTLSVAYQLGEKEPYVQKAKPLSLTEFRVPVPQSIPLGVAKIWVNRTFSDAKGKVLLRAR